MNSVVTLNLIADCSSQTYLFLLIKLILGFPVLFKSLLHSSVHKKQLTSAPNNTDFPLQFLGIIYLDKRLSSNPMYQCQHHSSNQFILQIWQQSLASYAIKSPPVWGMSKAKQSALHSHAASYRLCIKIDIRSANNLNQSAH